MEIRPIVRAVALPRPGRCGIVKIIYEEIEGLLPNIELSTQLEGHISR